MVRILPTIKDGVKVCTVCNVGKQQRGKFPKKSTWRASEKLELIHADLCGPVNPTSCSGKRYLFVLVDDFHAKHGYTFLLTKRRHSKHSKSSRIWWKKNPRLLSEGCEQTEGVNLPRTSSTNSARIKALRGNSLLHILLSKME